MNKKIACCGLDCSVCPAYRATLNNDDNLRMLTAEEWNRAFQSDLNPEDINCLGCKSELICRHCISCDIRICNLDQSLDNCAECDFYICDKLEAFLELTPDALKNLKEIRKRHGKE